MKLRLIVTALLVTVTSTPLLASSQSHNLNFEQTQNDKLLNWTLAANSKQYETKLEESQVQDGKYSASITFAGDKTGYEAWSYSIPSIYKGSKVTLKGYLKTENITKGRAGLMIHVGPPFKSSYMENIKVTGTNDWQEYEISVDSDLSKAKEIRVGAALIGNGKVWVDNLTVLIDGIPLSKAAKKELPPAKLDDEFNENSRIKIASLNVQSIANLAFLGKLWGFLKYHHPEIAKGQFNWDFELFRVLPTYLAAKNDKQREAILTKWIQKLGDVQECVTCPAVDENARLKPSLAWLKESNYSKGFKALVKHIFVNRHQGDSYYINHKGRTNFTNENPYNNQANPDLGFRLLAVYRFWNYVNYYFPYKDLIQRDWNQVLLDSIEKAHQVSSEIEYEMLMVNMISEITDSHAFISSGFDKINAFKGNNYPPVLTRYIEHKIVVTDFYAKDDKQLAKLRAESNLQIGDVVTHVDGQPIAERIKEREQLYSASNNSKLMLDLSADLLRSSNQELMLTIERGGNSKQIALPLYSRDDIHYTWTVSPKKKKSIATIEDNITYYWLETLEQEDIAKIEEKLTTSIGFIADLRGYPRTQAESWKVFTNVFDQPTSLLSAVYKQSSTPGEFRQGLSAKYPNAKKTFKEPVVVLVNAQTQSFSESLAMGFQAGENTITMGSQSSGANGQVTQRFSLPGGLYSMFTGSGAYYTDGTQLQQVGVKIDKVVEPTVKGIRESRDEVLEAAIAYIKDVSKQQTQVSP